jgi:Domain of unknown function (DUF4328)
VSADAVVPARTGRAYLSLGGRAGTAKKALGLVAAVNALACLFGLAHYRLLDRASTAGVTEAELGRSDTRLAFVAVAQLVFFLGASVFFIRWFHRAYANLEPLGAESLRYGKGWAIGAWFIPILNLFRPKRMADDIWRASDPKRDLADGSGWRSGKVPALFAWWWGIFIVTGILENAAYRQDAAAADLDGLKLATITYLASNAVNIVGAVLAIMVVARTTERQEQRASKVRAAQRLRDQAWQLTADRAIWPAT